jgi:hypothetical protein
VVKRRSGPRNCIVAGRAFSRRERRTRRGMDRIVGALPGAQVAAGVAAVCRLNVQAEIAVYVAQSALHVGMPVGQRKARGAVIEFAVGPFGDGMAGRASRSCRGKAGRNVVRDNSANLLRPNPIRRVARHAVACTQGVVVADVAGRTGSRCRGHVRTHQGETRDAVVKRRGIPPLGGMAIRTVPHHKCGARSRVDGIIGLLPGGEMAARCAASRGRNLQVVVVVDMAGSAGHVGVAVGQKEPGGAVVKDRVVPTGGVVALRAVCGGKGGAGLRMHWIVGALPGAQVAAGVAAIGGSNLQVVVIVDVARGAGYVSVAVG